MGQLDFISKWKSRSDVCCKRSRLKIIFFRKSKCSQDGIQTATPWCGPHDLPEGWQPPLLRCHRSECGTRHFSSLMSLLVIYWQSTLQDLEPLFEKFGDVGDIYLPTERGTGRCERKSWIVLNFTFYTFRSRGFAFVRFYDKHDAEVSHSPMGCLVYDCCF